MTYHVRIDHQQTGEPAITVLDTEPSEWAGRLKYQAYGRTYYVYSLDGVPNDLLIEIGRAVERKANKGVAHESQ